jgi:hypothetical protein
MSVTEQRLAQRKRWRGMILELVYDGHQKQESRLDHLTLWAMMRDLGQDVGQAEVLTLLQTLGSMQYLTFKQRRDDLTNQVRISEIEVTARGMAVVEKEQRDPLVHVL